MELYTLDNLIRRERVVERYESLIWTERFATAGDFELITASSFRTQDLFKPNTWLALSESFRCMKVETIENFTDDEGRDMTKVSGRSIETILEDRVAFNTKGSLTANPTWKISGLQPLAIALKIFNDICRDGTLDLKDIIPFLDVVALFPEDTIQGVTDAVTMEFEPQSVYDAIKGIAELYDFGFRLCRNYDLVQLVFDVYTGCDRTSGQSFLPPVIFSPDLENLSRPRELSSVNGSKNVAYVYSPVGFQVVYPENADPNVDGFERQVLVVKADDITETNTTTAAALMQQRGKEELSKHRNFGAFDGEVTQRSQYKYGEDYNLGDLVETRNSAGFSNFMRVTEQIFVSDREGDRSYPTLTTKKFVTPGSWASWPLLSWIDYSADPLAWADAP